MDTLLENPAIYLRFAIALALGLLVGIERGWSQRDSDEGERLAGVRTFSLVSLLGALWGFLSAHLHVALLAASLIGFVALLIVGYIYTVRDSRDLGLTTEIAAFITFSLGAAVAVGYVVLSTAVGVIMVLLLSRKGVLHAWLDKIKAKELHAGILFLLISAVMLPILPDRGFGPWDTLNPYQIWWMVVLIAGFSFVGYLGLRTLGSRYGILITSLSGGLVSSTAVTITLGGFAKIAASPNLLIGGVLLATIGSFLRVFAWVLFFNDRLLEWVWLPMLVMVATAALAGLWMWRGRDSKSGSDATFDLDNPLQLSTALQFGAALAVVLVLAEFSKRWFGDAGVYTLSVLSGLVDVDSLTLSMAKMAGDSLAYSAAANSIVLAAVSNTVVKGGIFLYLAGYGKGRKMIAILAAVAASGMLALVIVGS